MSARRTGEFAEQTYQAAERFKANALLTDDSLFTPGIPMWTPNLLGELHTRFLNRPDTGEGSTWEKLKLQLEGSAAEVYQLMGEVLYVHHLILSKKLEVKRRIISGREANWSPQPIAIPPELDAGLQSRFVNLGAGYAFIPFQVGTLIETVEQWKEMAAGQQESLLKDPRAFKSFLFRLRFRSELLKSNQDTGDAERQLLLHILFPDVFETILARDKGNICKAKAFAEFFDPQETDVDRKIQQIRQAIERKLRENFHFYDGDIRKYWKPRNGESVVEVFDAGEKVCREKGEGLKDLADRLYLPDTSFLKEIKDLLEEKRQVIFQGPPGTGKTFVARELAGFLAGGDADNRVTLVQFHPSYAYEDFVQGFRPTPSADGQVGFTLRDGPLLRAAERARHDEGAKHYLIIDEINRGNLAAVFGELYFLLEYRGEKMQLQYSDAAFTLPENLFIIGTMNTADRSIALVDLALRRRFYFVEFRPDADPIQGVLRQWLRAKAPGMEWVDGVVKRANELLSDSDAAIGPSYFMQDNLTEDKVALIWKHSVLPYIEERLYGNDDVRTNFALERLKGQGSGQTREGDTADSGEGAGNEPGNGEA